MARKTKLELLNNRIVACTRCERLIEHCRAVAHDKRAAYRDEDYFGKPVPNFLSCSNARVLVMGLAPAAHGANRTGRMFTGDRSGDFLYRAMYEAGFASQPEAVNSDDGLKLIDSVVTAAAHCAPPANKPTRGELQNCVPFLEQTIDLLPRLHVIVCLGKIGQDAVLRLYKSRGLITSMAKYPFGHGKEHRFDNAVDAGSKKSPPTLLCSYHPSQQNTFTGRLTSEMLKQIFVRAREIAEDN